MTFSYKNSEFAFGKSFVKKIDGNFAENIENNFDENLAGNNFAKNFAGNSAESDSLKKSDKNLAGEKFLKKIVKNPAESNFSENPDENSIEKNFSKNLGEKKFSEKSDENLYEKKSFENSAKNDFFKNFGKKSAVNFAADFDETAAANLNFNKFFREKKSAKKTSKKFARKFCRKSIKKIVVAKNQKNRNFAKKIFVGLFFAFLAANLSALEVPELKSRVNDYANVINKSDEKAILEYLAALDEQTGIQIAVLTIPSLQGEDVAAFGIKTAEKWKLGKSGEDNGALLLVSMEERKLRIEVGYGLENSLTDAKCGLIIRNVIIPKFKNGDYSGGILQGVQNMGGIASGNAELVDKNVLQGDENAFAGAIFIIIWLIFIFAIIGSRSGIFKWILLSNIANNIGRSNRSDSSGFGGGNGFSGGGGRFGGGGASGHW